MIYPRCAPFSPRNTSVNATLTDPCSIPSITLTRYFPASLAWKSRNPPFPRCWYSQNSSNCLPTTVVCLLLPQGPSLPELIYMHSLTVQASVIDSLTTAVPSHVVTRSQSSIQAGSSISSHICSASNVHAVFWRYVFLGDRPRSFARVFCEPLPSRYRMPSFFFRQVFLGQFFGGYLGLKRSKFSGEKQTHSSTAG